MDFGLKYPYLLPILLYLTHFTRFYHQLEVSLLFHLQVHIQVEKGRFTLADLGDAPGAHSPLKLPILSF